MWGLCGDLLEEPVGAPDQMTVSTTQTASQRGGPLLSPLTPQVCPILLYVRTVNPRTKDNKTSPKPTAASFT
jgi:hypothetical protein